MNSKTSHAKAEKTVLFIVYYFPPMGSSGVQRPLKFVKYLRDYGWDPIVLAPEPGAYHTFDESLQDELNAMNIEVHRVSAKTPFHLFGKSGRQIDFFPDRVTGWIRKILSFFYLPDNKTGWIKPALKKAEEIMEQRPIDVIYSTATPYSNHLISAELKQRTGKPVVMDFRDDWLEFPFSNYATRFHRKRAAQIERECTRHADVITANNRATLDSLKSRSINDTTIFRLLEHGFDPADFPAIPTREGGGSSKLRFMYSGIFYGQRKPEVFLKAMAELLRDGFLKSDEIELMFQGGLEPAIKEHFKTLNLSGICVDYGFVKHKEAVHNLLKSDVLWFIVGHQRNSNLITPGKIYEYMATRKPILGLTPEGEAAEALRAYQAGFICDPYDLADVKKTLTCIINKWRSNQLPTPDEAFINQHDRKKITGELAGIMDELI